MASTREIRERISSVKNTLKITNAMYMISSTKLNYAKAALASTEPFYYQLQSMIARILRHLPEDYHHRYLDHREAADDADLRRAIICVTADKGLAGAFNHNVLKMTENRLRPDSNDLLFVVGEVGRHYFSHRGIHINEQFSYTAQKPTLPRARVITSRILELFGNDEIDEVYIIYTQMKNAMATEVICQQLLPLQRLDQKLFVKQMGNATQEDFSMEPNPSVLLDQVIPEYLTGFIYSALIESYCSEHNARMQAMDAANKNGNQLVSELSVRYNRERQAAITQEITEVAAGARARKEQMQRAARRRAMKNADK